MSIRIKIVEDDSKSVVKVALIDDQHRVLFLKRSKYEPKHAGEWDLPGGHLKIGEDSLVGLTREVKEETSLHIDNPSFIEKQDHMTFFFEKYKGGFIKISH